MAFFGDFFWVQNCPGNTTLKKNLYPPCTLRQRYETPTIHLIPPQPEPSGGCLATFSSRQWKSQWILRSLSKGLLEVCPTTKWFGDCEASTTAWWCTVCWGSSISCSKRLFRFWLKIMASLVPLRVHFGGTRIRFADFQAGLEVSKMVAAIGPLGGSTTRGIPDAFIQRSRNLTIQPGNRIFHEVAFPIHGFFKTERARTNSSNQKTLFILWRSVKKWGGL